MRWLTIWMHTLFGRRDEPFHAADPDLGRARQIKRDQENRLLLIEREVELYELDRQKQRDHAQ